MSHTKHTVIARQLQSQLGISYQQALEHVRAGRDQELLASPRPAPELRTLVQRSGSDAVIYAAGFVTDSGTGGVEWRTERTAVEQLQREWIAVGDADVSDVSEIKLSDLPLDLDGAGLLDSAEELRDRVTEALYNCPDMWEPAEGQNRPTEHASSFECNPGHPDALAAGCTCDPDANRHGQYSSQQRARSWSVSASCPLHGFLVGWSARKARPTS